MKKRFNTTGVCVPRKHYMVDISNKLKEIEAMIENEDYFIINRPRQYGKTTTMFMLEKILVENNLVIVCSFEGIGDLIFQDEGIFSKEILKIFGDSLENNKEVYDFIKSIIIEGDEIPFVISDTIISQCLMYGIIRDSDGRCKIDNKAFELYIYNYMTSKVLRENKSISKYNFREKIITNGNNLDFEKVLLRFQQFMKEQYSSLDTKFIECEGRLLFLAFIKPIINGVGFDFKEVQISEEKRLDVVVTYNKKKYIIELKIWNGPKYHEKGIKQLCDYLDIHGLDKVYLVIFNFNKNKGYKEEVIKDYDKEIFGVFV